MLTTRSTVNVWRRFDQVDPLPGLVALGDSVCAFNPLYGQGMSAAAVSAMILHRQLGTDQPDSELPRRFFREQAEFLRIPWTLALLRDGAYDHATGTETPPPGWRRRLTRALSWPMFNLLSGAAREDPVVEAHFSRVYNIQQPLAEMLRNRRVLAGLAVYQAQAVDRYHPAAELRRPQFGATDHTTRVPA